MHHPPKALGQTCLNMFYFGALEAAEKIYQELEWPAMARKCFEKKVALRSVINSQPGRWMPQNTAKRYYLKHSNILAACFGVCDDETGRRLIHRIMSDEIGGDCQPYFMHYLLEAISRLGLREAYTRQICERWKEPVLRCSKGLVEGFVPPEPTYCFDHSHAWGGTPLYALPKALLGLEIREPGMRKLELSPSLLGLHHATVELLTPYGKVVCKMQEGEQTRITHPEEVRVIVKALCGDICEEP